VEIPRTAEAQRRAARPVSLEALSPGDLVFFRIHSRHVNHVGIYTGNGRFIHAPRSGERVSYGSLEDAYYHKHLVGAGRFWDSEASATLIPSPH
jgi:cell wall-associated NlpC family hydrolase